MTVISKLILTYENFERLRLLKSMILSYNLYNANITYIENDTFMIKHDNKSININIPNSQIVFDKPVTFEILKNKDNLLIIKFVQ